MPAYFDCGFSVRRPSWHGLETLLEQFPADWAEARKLAGLEWEPVPAPVYVASAGSAIGNVEVPGFQAITRSDNGQVLAMPTDSYSVISHADMGELIEVFLGTGANLKFETAGSVRDGRQVWALVRLDEPYTVPGDTSATYPFLAMLNAHDGSAACSLTMTDVRVVCWNTWTRADEQGAENGTRHVIRHTGSVAQRIEDAKDAVRAMRDGAKANQALFEQLAQTPVLDAQVDAFVEQLLPSPRDIGDLCTDRVHANVAAARGTWKTLYESSPTTEGIRGSAYGVIQTTTEYLDHLRGFRSQDSYVGRTILRPERAKGAALGLLRDVLASVN